MRHLKVTGSGKFPLDGMLKDAETEDRLVPPVFQNKHFEVCNALSPKEIFQYNSEDESISFNGATITKGIPVKILKSLLQSYLSEGKSEFEYREFKRQFDISLGMKNSNFEIRFYRLIDKYESSGSNLKIIKAGRGKFRIESSGVIVFKPEQNSKQVLVLKQ